MQLIDGVLLLDGIPLHPLVVHAVVVLLPIGAIAAFAVVFVRSLRSGFGLLTGVVLAASTASAYISSVAGQQLAMAIGVSVEHATYGIVTPIVATVATVAYGLWWWAVQVGRSDRVAVLTRRTLAGASLVFILGSLVLTVLAGHSGAKLSWDPKVEDLVSQEQ